MTEDTPETPESPAAADDATPTEPVVDAAAAADAINEAFDATATEPEPVAPPPAPKPIDGFVWGVGRRKTSVARVRMKYGEGKMMVNGKDFEEFFPTSQSQLTVLGPLNTTETRDKYDIFINVNGGGITGQSGATCLGIARALCDVEPHLEPALREGGFMTRDSRMKERKKYGLRGARRAFQFSKR